MNMRIFDFAVAIVIIVLTVGCKSANTQTSAESAELMSVNTWFAICAPERGFLDETGLVDRLRDDDLVSLEKFADAFSPLALGCEHPIGDFDTHAQTIASGLASRSDRLDSLALAPLRSVVQVLIKNGQGAWQVLVRDSAGGGVVRTFRKSDEALPVIRRLQSAGKRAAQAMGSMVAAVGLKQTNRITMRDGTNIDTASYQLSRKLEAIVNNWMTRPDPLYKSPLELPEIKRAINQGLSSSEAMGIYYYSRGGYNDFVKYLSGAKKDIYYGNGRISEEEAGALLASAVSALNKLPRYKGTVYFGAQLRETDYLSLLKEGKKFQSMNFTSTSLTKETAVKFAERTWENGADKTGLANFYFTIKNSQNGVDISNYSYWSEEKEILFQALQSFRVKSITQRAAGQTGNGLKGYDVVLEEIR
jgi:ADP-ribosyltransferase exoenzyme